MSVDGHIAGPNGEMDWMLGGELKVETKEGEFPSL